MDSVYGTYTFHGGALDGSNKYATNTVGFTTVNISAGTGNVRKTITGQTGSGMLLHVVHATTAINVSNLNLKNAIYINAGVTNPIKGGKEIGGGGLLLGGDGFGDANHSAPATISVTNVEVSGNKVEIGGAIDLTNLGTGTADADIVSNVYGGGILVNGIGVPNSTPTIQSDVTFTGVDIKNNTASRNMLKAKAGGDAKGGGARIAYAKSFEYVGGDVSGNTVAGNYSNWVGGGGLSIEAGSPAIAANGASAFGVVTLSGITVSGNTATIVNGNQTGAAFARGGGLFFWTEGNGKANITLDNGTTFSGNAAKAFGNDNNSLGINAVGGGANLQNGWGGLVANLRNANFTGNSASSEHYSALGGGIAVTNSEHAAASAITADFSGSTFSGNSALGKTEAFGGGAFLMNAAGGSTYVMNGVAFEGNLATAADGNAYGGALYAADGAGLAIGSKSVFKNNGATSQSSNGSAKARGGALYIGAGAAVGRSIVDASFEGNKARATDRAWAAGGAIYDNSAATSSEIANSSFINNSASAADHYADGGAIAVNANSQDWTVSNSTFSGNSASSSTKSAFGGAISLYGGAAANSRTILGSTFTNNSASSISDSSMGGAVYSTWQKLAVVGSTFQDNKAGNGGAIYNRGGETVNITDTSFTGNIASQNGGAIFMSTESGAFLNLAAKDKTVAFSGNKAGSLANAIYFGRYDGMDSHADGAKLNLLGTQDIKILDGFKAELLGAGAGGFGYANKTTGGTVTLGSVNTVDAVASGADIDFGAGTKNAFTDDFTLAAVNKTALAVKDNGATYRVNSTRDSGLALFQYDTEATGNSLDLKAGTSTFEVDGTTAIFGFEKDFLLAKGLGADNVNGSIGSFGSDAYTYMVGDDVWMKLDYQGNKEALAIADRNVWHAGDVGAFNDAMDKFDLTDAQAKGVADYVNSAVPGFVMNMGAVGFSGIQAASASAVRFGLGRYGAPASGAYIADVEDGLGSLVDADSFAHRGVRFWTGYIGDFDRMDSHGELNGYKANRHGFVSGFNYDFGEAGSVGFFGGYSHTKTKGRGAGIDSEVKSDAGHFGLIGRFAPVCLLPGFAVNADLGYTFTNNDSRRTMDAAGDVLGSFDQKLFTAGLEFEYALRFSDKGRVTPFFAARYSHLKQDGFTETGLMSATLDKFSGDSFQTRLGASLDYDFVLGCGDAVVTPSVSAAWRHEFGDRNFGTNAVFNVANPVSGFYQESARIDRDSADIGAAVRLAKKLGGDKLLGMNVGYNLNVGSNQRSHSLYAGFDIGF